MNYKAYMVIPVILLVLSVGILVNEYSQTGEFFKRSIDLKGGTLVTIKLSEPVDVAGLRAHLTAIFGEVEIRELSGITGQSLLINTNVDVDVDDFLDEISSYGVDVVESSTQQIGATLGEAFWYQAQMGIIIALIFMAIIVFLIFRTLVPSLAVISAVIFDAIITLALMQVFGIPLSLASLAAILMIIGYSVDTDILLTTRLLKGTGPMNERIINTLKTSLTMSITSIGALIVLILFGIAEVLTEIASVLLIGLVIDIIITWLMNAGILRWYMERRGIA